jgi:hypothetical protein
MHPDPDLLGSGLVGQSEGILRELMLKLFDHTPYDILIADFVMPRMNAPKLTRKCSLNRKLFRADLSISVVESWLHLLIRAGGVHYGYGSTLLSFRRSSSKLIGFET